MTYSFYKNADAVIIAFDLTSQKSFNSVTTWLQSIFKHSKAEDIPKVLCGNKLDLLAVVDNQAITSVNDQEAEQIAKDNDMIYIKTSAFNNTNVELLFHSTIDLVYEKKIKALIEKEKQEGAAG